MMIDSEHERTITIPSTTLSVDYCPISDLCRGNNLDVESHADRVSVDFRNNKFVSISQAAAITQVMKDRRARKRLGRVYFPPNDARRYLERMNFNHLLGLDESESFSRHDPNDRFIPMETLDDESSPSNLSDKLKSMVCKLAPNVDESVVGSLHMSFGEIMDNAVQHSETPSPGIAAAQYYPSRQFIELCVADGGKGVASSLKENPKYRGYSDDELAVMAFDQAIGQYVGRPDYANNRVSMGRGLFIASRMVSAMGGHLWMATRNTFVEASKDGIIAKSGFFFPGTLVVSRIPVKPGIVVKGNDIWENFAASPIGWSAEEGGLYYTDGNEENILW